MITLLILVKETKVPRKIPYQPQVTGNSITCLEQDLNPDSGERQWAVSGKLLAMP